MSIQHAGPGDVISLSLGTALAMAKTSTLVESMGLSQN